MAGSLRVGVALHRARYLYRARKLKVSVGCWYSQEHTSLAPRSGRSKAATVHQFLFSADVRASMIA
jgi:hypothetical protein